MKEQCKTMLLTVAVVLLSSLTIVNAQAQVRGLAGDSATYYYDGASTLYLYGSGEVSADLRDSLGWSNDGEVFSHKIKNFYVSDSITAISGFDFNNCIIENVDLGGVRVVSSNMFGGCRYLKKVRMVHVREIEANAFYAWENGVVSTQFTTIEVGDSLRYIGNYAFQNQNKLVWSGKLFPDVMESIGQGALMGVIVPDTVYFPASLRYVGGNVIQNSTANRFIEWNVPNGVGQGAFANGSHIGIRFGDSVTIVPNTLCSGAKYLQSVTFSPSIRMIDNYAFENCRALTHLDLPEGLDQIGVEAFGECRALQELTIPQRVTSIPGYMCYNCTAMERVHLPEGITTIGNEAFRYCYSLDSVHLPASIRNIGTSAFASDTSLTEITLPKQLIMIGDNAFSYCRNLRSISIPNTTILIGDFAFQNASRIDTIRCYAAQPPYIYEHTLSDVAATAVLLVPQGCGVLYEQHRYWGQLQVVEMSADETMQKMVSVEPTENTAYFTWPTDNAADTYVLDIRCNGEIFCHMIFGSYGQLVSIAFEAPSRRIPQAVGPVLSFLVTGLAEATRYTYTVATLGENEEVLHVYQGEFATLGYDGPLAPGGTELTPTPPVVPYEPYETGIEAVQESANSVKKAIEKGQIVILMPDGKKYNVQGERIQ